MRIKNTNGQTVFDFHGKDDLVKKDHLLKLLSGDLTLMLSSSFQGKAVFELLKIALSQYKNNINQLELGGAITPTMQYNIDKAKRNNPTLEVVTGRKRT
jgi:hypothetical protein